MRPKGRLRWALVVLLALIAINAVVAGTAFLLDPTGSSIGIPQEWLEDSPFADYSVPGLLLAGLGVLHGVAAVRQWTGARDGWLWAGASGVVLLVWIVTQAAMMGSFRHPTQTGLQAFCLAVGAATGLLALAQRRTARHLAPPEGMAPRLVLVADDATPAMQRVEEVAASLAKSMGAAVHAVVVGSAEGTGSAASSDVLFGHAVAGTDQAAKAIADRFAALAVPVAVHVERGQVGPALTDSERRLAPDVMLFGHTQRSRLDFPGYGSVLDQVKNDVAASVLVVHPHPFASVAVAIDGSQPSLYAAATGLRWAQAMGLPVTVLAGDGSRVPPWLAGHPVVPVLPPAAKFLLDWSRSHPRALLVVGARGAGNPGLLRMGSVSDQLAWGSGGSVLVVRPPRSLS